jgi:hypothetical protein
MLSTVDHQVMSINMPQHISIIQVVQNNMYNNMNSKRCKVLFSDVSNKSHRTLILLATTGKVPNSTQEHTCAEHDNCPVERGSIGIRCRGPWRPEEDEDTVHESNGIDWRAPATERPPRRRDLFAATQCTCVQNAPDRNCVGCHESHELERDDGIERYRGANVDK